MATFSSSSADGFVERFAGTATGGKHPEHAERDIRHITNDDVWFKPYHVRIPLEVRVIKKGKRTKSRLQTIWKNLPVILPWHILRHAMCGSLCSTSPARPFSLVS